MPLCLASIQMCWVPTVLVARPSRYLASPTIFPTTNSATIVFEKIVVLPSGKSFQDTSTQNLHSIAQNSVIWNALRVPGSLDPWTALNINNENSNQQIDWRKIRKIRSEYNKNVWKCLWHKGKIKNQNWIFVPAAAPITLVYWWIPTAAPMTGWMTLGCSFVVPPHRGWWRSSPTPRWQFWESRSWRGRRNSGRRSRGRWRSSGGGGVKIWMIQNFFQKSSSWDSLFKSRSQQLHFCSFTCVTFTF